MKMRQVIAQTGPRQVLRFLTRSWSRCWQTQTQGRGLSTRSRWQTQTQPQGRGISTIVKSPAQYNMPELEPSYKHGPLPSFVMQNFLKPAQRDSVAIVNGSTGVQLTYLELYCRTYSLAAGLKREFKVGNGDVVAICAPSHEFYFIFFHAVALAGGITTTINPQYTTDEVKYQIDLTRTKLIIAHPMSLATAKAAAGGRIPVVSICGDDAVESLLHELKDPAQIDTEAFLSPKTKGFDEHAVVTIPFSSGTTGRSKGVMLSHRNLTSNVLQTMPYEGKYLLKEHSKSGERGVLLCPLPFYHIFAMTAGMMVSTYCGAKLVFLPQFDLQRYLELIQEHKVSRGHVVPPIVLALAKHPMVDKYDLTSLECLMSGAAPLGAEVQLAAAKRLNCIVKQAWGMTETSPCGTITPDDDVIRLGLEAVVGRSGLLAPSTEAKIVNSVSGEDQPFTSEGELLVRGPQIMKGYFENEEATKSTLRSDGWLHTGDIAKFDEQGWLYITDRSKELIKFKGFQVPPAELEAIILTMPQVKDVVVIPVLDDEAGEVPRAYVVKQDSAPADFVADDVIEFVHARVAPYKRLRGGVRFTASVPKSPSGKLLRRVQIQLDRAAPAS